MEYIYCIVSTVYYAPDVHLDICFRSRGEAVKYLTEVKKLTYKKHECGNYYSRFESPYRYFIEEIPIAHFGKEGKCNVEC